MSKYTKPNPRTTYTTLDGEEIQFTPFSWDEHLLSEEGLKQEYRDRGEIVDCPQYVVTYAGGTQEKFDHDAKSITQAPGDTAPEDVERVIAEQKELWARYQDASKRFAAEAQAELTDLVYIESLAHIQMPTDFTAWEARLKKKHIKIPADPVEKRTLYINTEILRYRADQIDFMATVIGVSMGAIREEDLTKVKNSFRNQIRWDALEQVKVPAPKQVDGEPEANDSEGTQRVAINES